MLHVLFLLIFSSTLNFTSHVVRIEAGTVRVIPFQAATVLSKTWATFNLATRALQPYFRSYS